MISMDLRADIVPSEGLGGFYLGNHLADYSDIIEEYLIKERLLYKQVYVYTTRYQFGGFPVEINVDTRSGLVYMISAITGYKGKFDKSIYVGQSVKSVIESQKGFYYDECEEGVFSSQYAGISMDVSEEDPLPDEVMGLNIDAISVFLPEAFKSK